MNWRLRAALLCLATGAACGAGTPAAAADQPTLIEPDTWPYQLQYRNDSAEDQLLVLQEAGIELQLIHADGRVARLPDHSRSSLNFVLVPAHTGLTLTLAPRYDNSSDGGFTRQVWPLRSAAERTLATAWNEAALLAGSGQREQMQAACARYRDAAAVTAAPADWRRLNQLLLLRCSAAISYPLDAALLVDINNTVTVGNAAIDNAATAAGSAAAVYQWDWARGSQAFVYDRYAVAAEHFDSALQQLAALDSSDWPAARRTALQLDRAALSAELALAETVLSYNDAGTARDALLTSARQHLDTALSIVTAVGDHQLLATVHDNQAAIHYVTGNDQGVIDSLLAAKREIDLLGQPREALAVLGSIGDYYAKWGQLRPALDAYLQQQRIIEDWKLAPVGGDAYHNLASLYQLLGDLPRAQDMAERAIAVFAQAGNEYRTRIIGFELAVILEQQGELDTARQLLEDEVNYLAAQATPWEPLRLKAQAALSRIEARLGNVARARALSDEIFEHEDQLRRASSVQTIPVFINHAELAFHAGDVDGALALLQETLDEVAVQPADRISVMASMLTLLQQQDRRAEALALADSTFALIESQQVQLESSRLGPYWAGRMQAIYMEHVEYLLQRSELPQALAERAFLVAERARGISLRLRRQEMALAARSDDAVAATAWRQLLQEATALTDAPASADEALAQERRLTQARERFFALHAPELAVPTPPLRSLADTLAALPAGTQVLEFVVGPTQVWRFDLSAQGWSLTALGSAAQIAALADGVQLELGRSSGGNGNLQVLSDQLLQGLALAADTQQLLVSPAGRLDSIPFAALRHDGRYLLEHAALTVVPALGDYLTTATPPPRPHALELAVLADPAFGPLDTRTLAGALTDDAGELLRSWSDTLERLPATAQEAAALQQFYAEDQRMILTGSAATQTRFFSDDVRNARIIHIATHGYFDASQPELIGFAMSRDDGEDGFVSMAEIAVSHFAAELVVISACSTALGRHIPGEGNMSLARSFLAQGVDSVIATLWPVSDRATALFMGEFYRALNQPGASYASALQAAQQTLRSNASYRNPHYWAAYTLTSVAPQ